MQLLSSAILSLSFQTEWKTASFHKMIYWYDICRVKGLWWSTLRFIWFIYRISQMTYLPKSVRKMQDFGNLTLCIFLIQVKRVLIVPGDFGGNSHRDTMWHSMQSFGGSFHSKITWAGIGVIESCNRRKRALAICSVKLSAHWWGFRSV